MMKAQDGSLGMHRKIKRRDFVNGISVTAAGAFLLPQIAAAQEFAPEQAPDYSSLDGPSRRPRRFL